MASERVPRKRAEEVTEAALRVFSRKGYAGSSVDDIANELGILKGSLYYYIDSKEDLLFQVCNRVHQDVSAILREELGREGLSPLERLANYIRRQTIYNAEHVISIAVYYRDLDQLSPKRFREIRKRQREHVGMLVDLIEAAKDQTGVSADIDAGIVARTILSTVVWLYTWYDPKGEATPEEIAEFNVQYALRGLSSSSQETTGRLID